MNSVCILGKFIYRDTNRILHNFVHDYSISISLLPFDEETFILHNKYLFSNMISFFVNAFYLAFPFRLII